MQSHDNHFPCLPRCYYVYDLTTVMYYVSFCFALKMSGSDEIVCCTNFYVTLDIAYTLFISKHTSSLVLPTKTDICFIKTGLYCA